MPHPDTLPSNPVALAESDAERVFFQDDSFSSLVQNEDAGMISRLSVDAQTLGFIDRTYFMETTRGLVIPRSFGPYEKTSMIDLSRLAFEGVFRGYAKLATDRLVAFDGSGARKDIRALCLEFDDVTLLPYFDKLSLDRLLCVPILAAVSIERTD